MTHSIRGIIAAIALATPLTFALAQTAQDQEDTAHHPEALSAPQARPDTPMQAKPPARMEQAGSMARGQTGGMGMMGGDMPQMMPMMQMMQMMRAMMMQDGMGPMGGLGRPSPFTHVEGQIAFYRTELQITDTQAPLWNAFADVLRASTKAIQEAFKRTAAAGTQGTAPEQMDRRISLLAARLDAMKAVEAAGKPLYAALSDEQKKTADELLAEHFGRM